MPDQQHLYLLKQNLNIWNEWRRNNPEIEINLIEADLSEINLSGANLSNVDLSGAKLISADLSRVNFSGAYLSGANLSFANLNQADFSFSYLEGCDLSFANLDRANFSGAHLSGANLSFADLTNVDLSFANLTKANFTESNAKLSKFSFADSSGVIFFKANLLRADFEEANLSQANFSFAIALFANFKAAVFTGATVEGWKINSYTILDEVVCDRVYLKSAVQDHNSNNLAGSAELFEIDFAPGEFTRLFQKTRETIKLIFVDGIDWACFVSVFKTLLLEWDSSELSIKAIEAESSGGFVILIEGHFTTEKQKIEESFWLNYNTILADRISNNSDGDTQLLNTDPLLQILEIFADRLDNTGDKSS